jgi:PSP1 C-terminal conserved region
MSAPLTHRMARAEAAHDQFIVNHGKSGIVGVFTAIEALPLRRGRLVVVQTSRGVEIGAVLGPATLLQARLLGADSAGSLLRAATPEDEMLRAELALREHHLFEQCRVRAVDKGLALEILDVDFLFDGQNAIVQFLGQEADAEAFAQEVEQQFGLNIRLENLAVPTPPEEHEHGCGKPDCGREDGEGGGCTTCSTGGGCSSCGSNKVDMREYFGHLRAKMETSQRIPLA